MLEMREQREISLEFEQGKSVTRRVELSGLN